MGAKARWQLLFLLASSTAMAAAGKDVDLKAPDGTVLKATYFSAGKPGPGVVLLHMCNSNRKAWAGVAESLAGRGIHAITLDYRGYGESGGERYDKLPPMQSQQMVEDLWPGDIDRAFEYLVAQPGVDRQRIGAGGGSCGVNNAIRLARRHPEVKTLVLLAGGTTRPGQEFLEKSPWMPIFASAAHDDGDAVGVVGFVQGFSSNPMNELKVYADGGHGTEIFAKHRDLEPTIVAWFERHLVTRPVRATAGPAQPGPSGKMLARLREPGGAARTLAEIRQGKKPTLPSEGVINAVGYEALQAGRPRDAVEILAINVELFPDSANAYDSLSEAYEAAKDRPKAVEYARKALEALPRDKKTGPALKAEIQKAAEARIAGK